MTAIFGKYASLSVGAFTVHNIVTNHYYLLSILCLGLQAVCWQFALKEYDLFWAYLFMSGIYIVIPAASYFIFRESVSLHNIIGSLVIMAGIIILFTNTRETGRV
jgi:multidrug transporter EmrE-like cation transporter